MKSTVTPEASFRKVAVWYAIFSFVQAAATGSLIGTATDFALKDVLHLDAPALARYGTIVGLPVYVAFLFGYVRDRWSFARATDSASRGAISARSVYIRVVELAR